VNVPFSGPRFPARFPASLETPFGAARLAKQSFGEYVPKQEFNLERGKVCIVYRVAPIPIVERPEGALYKIVQKWSVVLFAVSHR
jgi:hypothetical protein